MKQSNTSLRLFPLIWSASFFLFSLAYILFTSNFNFESSNDHASYAYCLDTELVTNWHSALFCWEHIFIKHICATFGYNIAGRQVLEISYYISSLLVIIILSLMLYKLSNKRAIFALSLIPFWGVVCILKYLTVGLDGYFVCFCLISISFVYVLMKSESPFVKICTILFLLLALIHMAAYRKNSIFCIFFISYFIYPFIFRIKKRYSFIVRSVLSGVFSVVAYFLANNTFDTVLPTIRDYPVIPFMLSDISAVSTLTGEPLSPEHPIVSWRGTQPTKICNLVGISGADGELCNTVIQTQMYKPGFAEERAAFYQSLKKEYIRCLCDNSQEMIIGKIIQISQFYSGGKVPAFLKRRIENHYPHLKTIAPTWADVWECSTVGFLSRVIVPLGCILGIGIGLYKNHYQKYTSVQVARLAFLMGGVYYLSFSLIPPSAEMRYLLPSLALILSFFPCLICSFFLRISMKAP